MSDDKNNTSWPDETKLLFTELLFNVGIETDRQLLTLSAGGLGLLLTLLTTKGADNYLILALYGITATLFIATIFCILLIMDKNKDYIKDVIKIGPHSSNLLRFLDKVAKNTFRFAAGFALVLAILVATVGIEKEDKKMAEQNQPNKNTNEIKLRQESIDGFAAPYKKVPPKDDSKKSPSTSPHSASDKPEVKPKSK